jgi:hypothetical protein
MFSAQAQDVTQSGSVAMLPFVAMSRGSAVRALTGETDKQF